MSENTQNHTVDNAGVHLRIEFNTQDWNNNPSECAVAVRCPSCLRWYDATEITQSELVFGKTKLDYMLSLATAHFICPRCGIAFQQKNIENAHITFGLTRFEVLNDCYLRKVTWEKNTLFGGEKDE